MAWFAGFVYYLRLSNIPHTMSMEEADIPKTAKSLNAITKYAITTLGRGSAEHRREALQRPDDLLRFHRLREVRCAVHWKTALRCEGGPLVIGQRIGADNLFLLDAAEDAFLSIPGKREREERYEGR